MLQKNFLVVPRKTEPTGQFWLLLLFLKNKVLLQYSCAHLLQYCWSMLFSQQQSQVTTPVPTALEARNTDHLYRRGFPIPALWRYIRCINWTYLTHRGYHTTCWPGDDIVTVFKNPTQLTEGMDWHLPSHKCRPVAVKGACFFPLSKSSEQEWFAGDRKAMAERNPPLFWHPRELAVVRINKCTEFCLIFDTQAVNKKEAKCQLLIIFWGERPSCSKYTLTPSLGASWRANLFPTRLTTLG